MDASALDYHLPDTAIAQSPLADRAAARLLVDRGAAARPEHRHVRDLPDLLVPGDVLVVNDSRVLPARLQLQRPTGGAAEVLLLERRPDGSWDALVRPSRKLRPGMRLTGGAVTVDVGDAIGDGQWRVWVEGDLDAVGEMPLPPYIHTRLDDGERYQTVYARRAVSAAAPTAGLHLTREVLDACSARGIEVATVELAIGLDTFRPLTEAKVEDHVIHSEAYEVPEATLDAIERSTRVVAVGTTVVRALESVAATGERGGRTQLFIRPGFEFRAVDVLLTNFHLPRTTLLAMIEAFMGPRWRDLYALALKDQYRFLSFGDAMLVERA